MFGPNREFPATVSVFPIFASSEFIVLLITTPPVPRMLALPVITKLLFKFVFPVTSNVPINVVFPVRDKLPIVFKFPAIDKLPLNDASFERIR